MSVLFDDVSMFIPTSLQVVLCMSVWSVLQFQTKNVERFTILCVILAQVHANIRCIVPILVYVPPKKVQGFEPTISAGERP